MKYCKYCGHQLQDTEICTCPDSINANNKTNTIPTPEDASMYTDNVAMASRESQTDFSHDTEDSTPFEANESATSEQTLQNQSAIPSNTQEFAWGANQQQTVHKSQSVLKTALKNIFPYMKSFFKSPNKTIHTSAQNTDLPLACIFYGIYLILTILFHVIIWSKVSNGLKSFSDLFSSLFNNFGMEVLKISYPYVLLYAFLLGLLYILLTIVFMILVGGISGSKYNIKQMIAATSGIFVIPSLCYIFALMAMLLSVSLSLYILAFGAIAYLLMFFYISKSLSAKSEHGPFLWVLILFSVISFMTAAYVTVKIPISFGTKVVKLDYSSINGLYNDYYYDDDYSDYDYFDDFFNDYDDFFGQ